jgi:hypothetical protein
MPSTLLEIGNYCFEVCSGLAGDFKLRHSLQKLGVSDFRNCNRLTGAIEIPLFLKNISDDSFKGCDGLIGVKEAVQQYRKRFNQWKARGNVLCCTSKMDML